MTGEELGIMLLKLLATVQSGKIPKRGLSTADITKKSNEIPKPEYDNFYYMSQIGNLITNLSKQADSYNYQFNACFGLLDRALEEIIRAERTKKLNKELNDSCLLTYRNFYLAQQNLDEVKHN